MTLPTEYKARKDIPLYDGTVGYFPLAFREMARVSMDGNEQHNAGEPLHWAREKSTDQINTAFRHLVDSMSGVIFDGLSRTDGKPIYHLAKTFWRIGAALQLLVEQTEAREIFARLQTAEKSVYAAAEGPNAGVVGICEWTAYPEASCQCESCSLKRAGAAPTVDFNEFLAGP